MGGLVTGLLEPRPDENHCHADQEYHEQESPGASAACRHADAAAIDPDTHLARAASAGREEEQHQKGAAGGEFPDHDLGPHLIDAGPRYSGPQRSTSEMKSLGTKKIWIRCIGGFATQMRCPYATSMSVSFRIGASRVCACGEGPLSAHSAH